MTPRPITDEDVRRFLGTFYQLGQMRDGAIRDRTLDDLFLMSGYLACAALEEYEAHRAMRANTQALRDAYAAAEASDAA